MTWEEFLTLACVDMHFGTNHTFQVSDRAVERSSILLEIEESADTSDGDFKHHAFSLHNAVAHLTTTNPSGILSIEK